MDPDQTAPTGAVWSGSTLFDQEASKTFQQTTGVLRVKTNCCEAAQLTFQKMTDQSEVKVGLET